MAGERAGWEGGSCAYGMFGRHCGLLERRRGAGPRMGCLVGNGLDGGKPAVIHLPGFLWLARFEARPFEREILPRSGNAVPLLFCLVFPFLGLFAWAGLQVGQGITWSVAVSLVLLGYTLQSNPPGTPASLQNAPEV